ncbi:PREDICTED: uncharacterized protein LOC104759633 [Camelina sativa]|uniref:Uncharacterized protein LOC104759633 n=1 Tax=Camelina sativa TaxID=90675 RepID=A0ABM0X547_CAMSA|nr:PREDICTED: uncharacterized protein LOC104759633 [Camelina sativa]
MEFTKHFGKFRSLWAELEMLRPATIDPTILNERREQDKVFGLLLTLNPSYNDLIKHILRSDKLPSLDDVCNQIQKEHGSMGLFGSKGELVTANKAEMASANKGYYRPEDKNNPPVCEHCKKLGHFKSRCWILHPHLAPPPGTIRGGRPNRGGQPRAHQATAVGEPLISEQPQQVTGGTALAAASSELPQQVNGGTALAAASSELVRRSDIDALIKALKEATGKAFLTSNKIKPLIVDYGASHHMISDSRLISDIKPANGNVIIANGEKVPVKGIGNLKLFDKETKDIETSKVLGQGGSKDDLYVLEDLNLSSNASCFNSIKILRSDNGGEYTSHAFKQYLAKYGILHQTSCPYTPQQNGVAERKNRHLMEVARSMMFHTRVPKRFWGDDVLAACYLINRTPTKILKDLSPFEVLTNDKPTFDHLRVFGCVCYVLRPGELRDKLDAKSTKAMFLGYSTTQKGYKCYEPTTRRVLVSRDVKFMETQGFYDEKNWDELRNLSDPDTHANDHTEQHEESPEPPADNTAETTEESAEQLEEIITPGRANSEAGAVVPLRRSQRIKYPPTHWKNTRVYYNNMAVAHPIQAVCTLAHFPIEHQVFLGNIDENWIPKTYDEAKQHKVWRDAVDAENTAMVQNHTWDEADLPKGKKAVTSRYIFTIKYKSNGEI